MKVKDLLKLVNNLKEQLEGADQNLDLDTVSNTYFLGAPRYFLGLGGEGYLNLDEVLDGSSLAEPDLADKLDKLYSNLNPEEVPIFENAMLDLMDKYGVDTAEAEFYITSDNFDDIANFVESVSYDFYMAFSELVEMALENAGQLYLWDTDQ